MVHQLIAEFMGTALMIIFGVGVHCSSVLKGTKYRGSGHIFAITTWGFGISVALFIFGNVCINPAMVLAQCLLGNIAWCIYSVFRCGSAWWGRGLSDRLDHVC